MVLADGTRVRAPVVVSAAGAHHTYRTLLPGSPAAGTDRLEGMRRGFPFVVLFLGLDGDPEELGLPREGGGGNRANSIQAGRQVAAAVVAGTAARRTCLIRS